MESNAILNNLIPWALGLASAVIGFGVKWVTDYLWLTSPRLICRAVLVPAVTDPPVNGYRIYHYNLLVEIQNHSKNEAYGLEILKLVMPTGVHSERGKTKESYEHVVSDNSSAKLSIGCYVKMKVDEKTKGLDSAGRMKEIQDSIRIHFRYKNQLGKQYSKTSKVVFQPKLSIIHSMKVVSFTPAETK